MNPNLLHQELARVRYAEMLRDATRAPRVAASQPKRFEQSRKSVTIARLLTRVATA
jgi:hypothetical protein